MPKRTPPTEEPPTADESAGPSAPPPTAPAAPQHTHRFFVWIRSLGLVRQPGWIGGVSAGIADRIGVDVIVVRGVLVVIAVLGGPAVLLYALAWLVLPDASGRIHLENLIHGRIDSPIVGIAVLIALSLLPVAQGFWWFGSQYWGAPQWGDSVGRAVWTIVVLAALVGFVIWASRRAGTRPEAAPAAPGSATTADSATTTTTTANANAATDTAPTIPLPAAGADAAAATMSFTAEPQAPAAPPTGASGDELAAWRASQEQWRSDHAAYRREQADARRAAAAELASAAQAQRAERAAAQRERDRRTRSHPLYSVALIGVALVAGAITVIDLGQTRPAHWLAGAAVTLGVLGLGIIVNGIMGRRSGGASGIAWILAIGLFLIAIFPQSATRHYVGDVRLAPHANGTHNQSITYLQGSGNVTLDLTSYYSTPRPAKPTAGSLLDYDEVDLYVATGNVTVEVPADEYNNIVASTAGGHVITPTRGDSGGEYYHENYPIAGDRDLDRAAREIAVTVRALHGNITIIEEENAK